MADLYIDNAKRKRIVTFWIPVCLGFLHIWASLLVVAVTFGHKENMDGETIRAMFSSCTWGVGFLILLLISDKALEFIIAKFVGNVPAMPGVVEKTTTTETVKTVAAPTAAPVTDAKDVNINATGDVNVSNSN